VYTDVHEGVVDLGLVAFPAKKKGLKIEPFWKDKLVVICPPGHALAGKKQISLRDLDGEKFISFEPDLPTRKAIDRLLKNHKVNIEQVMEFDNIETVKRAVEIESGISLVPETTVSMRRGAARLSPSKSKAPTCGVRWGLC
jgi:DNA-binding transcriptional LysR family regulator